MDQPRIGSLCTGYGGLDMAAQAVYGGELRWAADPDPGASKILAHHHPGIPNLGDITSVDFTTVEPVDILTAGFPCQDVSMAGQRAGLAEGTRSGLWRHVARAIDQLRPSLVVIENVRGLLSARADSSMEPCPWCMGDHGGGGESPLRALGAVLADLASLGFDAEWHGVPASTAGAAHERFRVFILAWPALPDSPRLGRGEGRSEPAWLEGRPDAPISGGAAPADSADLRQQRGGQHGDGGPDLRTVIAAVAADADREPGGQRGDAAPVEATGGRASAVDCGCDRAPWGRYAPAVHRWEQAIGRAAPSPVNERGRLAPEFVEFLMGLPEGHVTAVPGVPRNAQLKALGNGVVPQQAGMAIRLLHERVFGA